MFDDPLSRFAGWHSFKKFLYPEEPYEQAQNEVDKGWDEGKQYEKPYNQAGQDQIPKLQGAEDQLLNPTQLQDDWLSHYSKSPYVTQLQNEAENSGLESASSQGLLGSSTSLNNIQQGASNIMNKDRQNYMNDLMEKYKTGINLGQNTYNQGAETGRNMSEQANKVGGQRAELKFGANQAPIEQFKSILNMMMKAGMMAGTGGAGGSAGAFTV